jgi:Ni/Co efflux regulator RcnB
MSMKKMVLGLLIAAMAVPAAPAVAQRDRGWSDRQREEDSRANRDDRRGQWQEQSSRRDNGRHRSWGRNRGHNYHWHRGQQMGYNDWNSARRIDYRRYHLRQPPRGYEWRRNNDRFLLVAVATGVIMSVILSGGR